MSSLDLAGLPDMVGTACLSIAKRKGAAMKPQHVDMLLTFASSEVGQQPTGSLSDRDAARALLATINDPPLAAVFFSEWVDANFPPPTSALDGASAAAPVQPCPAPVPASGGAGAGAGAGAAACC